MSSDFVHRHIGPQPADLPAMLAAVGAPSLDALMEQTVPAPIRRAKALRLPAAEDEHAYLTRLRAVAAGNRLFASHIGLGYSDCITPPVILRNVLENPGWYTPYTPYQAEIAQGRLEALLNFQTVVRDLTGMDVANASLLDEATAAAEAMAMMRRLRERAGGPPANVFFASDKCLPQTLAVLRSRAEAAGIEVRTGHFRTLEFTPEIFGALVQFPDADGNVCDYAGFIKQAHAAGAFVAVAADLLGLTLLTPPGEMGADIALGSAQRFGVPMGCGGPHAAYFATREAFIREMPGRIIGVSVDAHGHTAYRMSLQTREQHIRREKAKSNICTAQALLANMAGFYAVWHGPDGLAAIARRVHGLARRLEAALKALGCVSCNPYFFDTLKIGLPDASGALRDEIHRRARRARMNFRDIDGGHVGIALDETTTAAGVQAIVNVFAAALGAPRVRLGPAGPAETEPLYHRDLLRTSAYLTHPVFHAHRSETQMMRYLKALERKDLGLDAAMIPLGSCTMKLNAAAEMMPVTWPEFGRVHPFAPADQRRGYTRIFAELEKYLAEATGLAAVSLQPNSGAQGEYAGLMVVRAYHRDRGQGGRDIALIPASAHGTNPASAVMAGLEVVVVACDAHGHIDLADLEAKAELHRDRLAVMMLTYPSTYGVFEESVREVVRIVHERGGQVYMDGANMNAQVGLTSPGAIGADVCHLNLHKTFAIPHGGGGPGMGPIAVAAHLAPYLPGHPVVKVGGERAIHAVSAGPWGSASILLIAYGYIRLLGPRGLADATRYAILNANYIKARLEKHFDVQFAGAQGRVAHELIFDLRPLKEKSGVDESDVAKRLMDYGFHAPTVSWPVPGTMMIEPTESEPKAELDRLCDALLAIRQEIQDVIDGRSDRQDNPLKNAPHTAEHVCGNAWPHAYSREQAAFPAPGLRHNKFWPAVGRIDNTHGDRNLVCSCPPLDAYQ